MTNITLRWSAASDAVIGSTYKIERTLDNVTWTTLAAAQAATSPYSPIAGSLASNGSYGDTSLVLTVASAFGSTGYAWIDDALISWSGKSSNTLTGVLWYSGYGTYSAGTALVTAHESYADSGVTISANAVLYRITHILGGVESHPTYVWYFAPPAPASGNYCVVVVAVATDLGFDPQEDVTVTCALASGDQVADLMGHILLTNRGTPNTQTTNVFGLAFFQCWRDSARHHIGDETDATYVFTVDGALAMTAQTIPNQDWVLLPQIV